MYLLALQTVLLATSQTLQSAEDDGKMESDLLNVAESFSFIAFRPSEVHLLKDAEKF